MTTFNAINRKNNAEVTAVELETGRFQITEAGNIKEVAASTFKRWYTITGEVVEAVASELDALLEDAQVIETAPVAQDEPKVHVTGVAERVQTRGGKCEKVVTVLEFNNAYFQITEYDGFVCDVTILNAKTHEVEYKSPKMSIKDALSTGLGLEGDALKQARKQVMALKKLAKEAI